MSDDYEGPCRTCGGPVTVDRVPEERSCSDPGARWIPKRRCLNPECVTNNPKERGLNDVV